MSERVVVASSPRSCPDSSLRRWNARKSEHCLPSTSITWMNSPARTSYARAVAESTRKSRRGSASGGGSSCCSYVRGRGAAHLDEELGGRRRAVDDASRRRGDDHGHGPLRPERLRGAGRRPPVEEPDRERLRGVEPTRAELVREQAAVAIGERCPDHGRRRVRLRLERSRVVASVRPEHGHLRRLPAVRVDDRHALVGAEREHGRPARPDEVRLDEGVLREEAPDEARGPGRAHRWSDH